MSNRKTFSAQIEFQNEFLNKYGDKIRELSLMPKQTEEEQEKRFNWFFEDTEEADDLCKLLYKSVKLLSSIRIENDVYRLTQENSNKKASKIMSDLEEKDSKLHSYFMISLFEVVKSYTGYTYGGEPVTFFQAIGQKIQNKFYSSYIEEQTKMTGKGIITTRKILKLAKLGKEKILLDPNITREELLLMLTKISDANKNLHLGRSSIKCAVNLAMGYHPDLKFQDDLEKVAKGQQKEEKDVLLEHERKMFPTLLNFMFGSDSEQMLEETKKYLFDGTYRSTWEWFLWFLHIETLVQLKLDEKNDVNDLSDVPEKIPFQAYKKVDLYRYSSEPAGNEIVYNDILDASQDIFNKIMQTPYIDMAFNKKIQNMDALFYEYLKTEFDFSEGVQVEARGGKGTLHNYQNKRRKYDNEWKKTLLQFYFEQKGHK